MKYNNLFIALILHITFASHTIFCSESIQQAPSWWHKAKVYMASWMPQYIKNKISSSSTPQKDMAFSEKITLAKSVIPIKLEAILDMRKAKNFNVIQHINIFLETTYNDAKLYSFDAESEINKAIDIIMKKVDPNSKEKFNFFLNMKEFIQNKVQEKKEKQ